MMHKEEYQPLLDQALAQIKLPIDITIRTWREDDFVAIQRLSSIEGWPTPERRPDDALAGWHAS